jgi:hypothetical protein
VAGAPVAVERRGTVFDKAAKDIARLLETSGGRGADWPGNPHAELVARLRAVTTLAELLAELVNLERLVHLRITVAMAGYELDRPIRDQPDRSGVLLGQARLLFAAYRRVFADPAVIGSAIGLLGPVATQITVAPPPGPAQRPEVGDFLGQVRNFVLFGLALLAAPGTGASANLLTQLRNPRQVTVQLRIVYKEQLASLLALPGGPATHCVAGPHDPADDLRTRVSQVVAGAGAPTEFGAPVWLEDGGSAGELQAATFDRITVDVALDRIFTGSLSFARDGRAFYTPPRIEVLHELVHAVHNANGLNREGHPGLTADERHLWSNAEEYWTIAADPIGENALNAQIQAPGRWGHGGLPLPYLAPSTEAAALTLRQHARLGPAVAGP